MQSGSARVTCRSVNNLIAIVLYESRARVLLCLIRFLCHISARHGGIANTPWEESREDASPASAAKRIR